MKLVMKKFSLINKRYFSGFFHYRILLRIIVTAVTRIIDRIMPQSEILIL